MKICICSSMAFYEQFNLLRKELENMGHVVVAPELEFSKEGGDTSNTAFFEKSGGIDAFPPEHDVWKKKGEAISAHFKKILESDSVLITNYEKKGIENYIGGNTFLEIGFAFGNNKKIFILNDVPKTSAFKEEILGMQPIVLNGDLSLIK